MSGVACVPGAREQKYFCAPPTKTAEFNVKNRHKSAKKTKPEHLCVLLLLFFGSNKVRSTLETHSTKLQK